MRMNLFITIAIHLIFLHNQANASLIDLGNNSDYLFDDRTGYVWDMNISTYGNLSYSQQIAAISGLTTVFDVNQDGTQDTLAWQFLTEELALDMMSYLGFSLDNSGYTSQRINGPLDSTSSLLFFTNVLVMANEAADTGDNTFWSGRIANAGEMYLTNKMAGVDAAYQVLIENGGHMPSNSALKPLGAWMVAKVTYSDNVAPIPEPATVIYMGISIVGLIGSMVKRKKK